MLPVGFESPNPPNFPDSQDQVQVRAHEEVHRRPGLRAQEGVQALPQDGLPQGPRPGRASDDDSIPFPQSNIPDQ